MNNVSSVEDLLFVLKDKYNYCDELLAFLNKLVPALFYTYGEDKKGLIFNSLIDCEIHIQPIGEKPEEYYNSYYGINRKLDLPFIVGGIHHDELLFDENGNVFDKQMIYLRTDNIDDKKFDFNNKNNLACIVHEVCHLVKSYNRLLVDGDRVNTYCGMVKTGHKYDSESKRFVETGRVNVGLEEALNCCDEEDIMTMLIGEPYKTKAYKDSCSFIRCFLENPEFRNATRDAQFNYSEDWKNVLGVEASDALVNSFDTLVNLYYVSGYEWHKHKEEYRKKRQDSYDCLQGILDNMNNKVR